MSVLTSVRTTTAASPLVARRRALADLGMLALTALLVAVTAFVALAGPRVVVVVADRGARGAVLDARPASDVVVVSPPQAEQAISVTRDPYAAALLETYAAEAQDGLPDDLDAVTGAPVHAVDGFPWPAQVGDARLTARLGYVHGTQPDVTWVRGTAPEASPHPHYRPETPLAAIEREVQVGVSEAAARDYDIELGERVQVQGALVTRLTAVITGVYRVADPGGDQWIGRSDFVTPQLPPARSVTVGSVGLLTTDDSLPDMLVAVQGLALKAEYRFPAQPDTLTAAEAPALVRSIVTVVNDPSALSPNGQAPTVLTEMDDVLLAYQVELAGAVAQSSVLLVGLVATSALLLVLAARLLVARRAHVYSVERARGGSVASVAWRALLESVPLTAVAAGVGVAAAVLAVPDRPASVVPALVVALAAMLAPAVLAAALVRAAWSGRRVPANRIDRDRLRQHRRTRRTVAELALLVLAVAALVSVRSRGLLQDATGGVDWLLAATPVLLAAAATVVVVRVLPPVLAALAGTARRTRGLAWLVATARARLAGRTGIPLLALTMAVALVAFSGATVATIHTGQGRAADAAVGADVRVDGPVAEEVLDELRAAPGVTDVVGFTPFVDRTFGRGTGVKAQVLAVDAAAWADLLVRRGEAPPEGLPALAALAEPTGDGLPALASERLLHTAEQVPAELWLGDDYVPLDLQGATDLLPAERQVIVDRALASAATGDPVVAEGVWVNGPGAAEAVRAAGLAGAPGITVTERDAWLQTWRDAPLHHDLRLLFAAASVVLALYAAVAVALTVVGSSQDRARTLGALRAAGMSTRATLAATFGEIAPIALAAVVAGTAIGVAVPWSLTGALGLERITGEVQARLAVDPLALGLGAFAVLGALVVAVLVEHAVRRRDSLSRTLREDGR